jgi:hypothetical protein
VKPPRYIVKMEFSSFKRQLLDATSRLQEIQIVAAVAGSVLSDFPNNLPDTMRSQLLRTMEEFAESCRRTFETRATHTGASKTGRVDVHIDDDSIASPVLAMYFANHARGSLKPDFSTILFVQCLVTALAQVDGFLNDCVRAACRQDSRLLRRNKQLRWEEIIEAGSWENLLEQMIDNLSFEFGWKDIAGRIQFLDREFGLSIEVDDKSIGTLDAAYQVRNVMVHNGGRVSAEYLRRTRRRDVTVGEALILTEAFTREAVLASEVMCVHAFLATAIKFFDRSEIDINGITFRSLEIVEYIDSRTRQS